MPRFEIESHIVSTCVERLGHEAVTTRLLALAGPVLEGDIQHRALITFSDRPRSPDEPVGHLSRDGRGGVTVMGWLASADLEAVLATLVHPAVLHYRLAFGQAESGYLDRLRIDPIPRPAGQRAGPELAGQGCGGQAETR